MEATERILLVMNKADFYRERGFSVIPLIPGTKKPAIKWKEYTERHATDEEIHSWTRLDIGLVMGKISGYVGIDADTKIDARHLYNILPLTTMVTQTANGGHLIYRTNEEVAPAVKTTIKGIQCDIRGEGSYLVAAPSLHPTGESYRRWGEWKQPPFFQQEWIESVQKIEPGKSSHSVSKYIAKIEAVSGEGGHNNTFRAACKCRDAGVSESEALAMMMEWNLTNAEPPWTAKELLHKVQSAFKEK